MGAGVRGDGGVDAARLRGVILGCAAGDAMGLPYEGLTAARGRALYGSPGEAYRFVAGRGMISDDTEHTLLVAQAVLAHPEDAEAFGRRLAWGLRGWMLAMPAGLGMSTLRACVRLCVGFGFARSGVYSAGNGPAMRAAILGARFAHDPDRRARYLEIATHITHTDPKALTGARAVAEVTAWAIRGGLEAGEAWTDAQRDAFLALVRDCAEGEDADWAALCDALDAALTTPPDPTAGTEDAAGALMTVEAFAASLGLESGVTGYMYHTVPVVLFAFARHPGDWRAGVEAVMRCGGDVDSTAAILGAMTGAVTGEAGVPAAWLDGLIERPRSVPHMRAVADALAARARPVSYAWPLIPARNLLFLLIVMAHGFRRLAPPYR